MARHGTGDPHPVVRHLEHEPAGDHLEPQNDAVAGGMAHRVEDGLARHVVGGVGDLRSDVPQRDPPRRADRLGLSDVCEHPTMPANPPSGP